MERRVTRPGPGQVAWLACCDARTEMTSLTPRSLRSAARRLAGTDPVLGASVERFGPPPLWAREPSYATLVHLILEQQVSLASAQAAFDRLVVAIGEPTPTGLLTLDDVQLRTIGFSRQKAGYARDLAAALLDGFDLAALAGMSDDAVRAELVRHRGIGRWTADVYLTMVPAASRRLAARGPGARYRGDGGRGSLAPSHVRAARGDGAAMAAVPRRRGTHPLAPLSPRARHAGRLRGGAAITAGDSARPTERGVRESSTR